MSINCVNYRVPKDFYQFISRNGILKMHQVFQNTIFNGIVFG